VAARWRPGAVSARWLYRWAAWLAALLPVRGPGVVATPQHRAHVSPAARRRRSFGRCVQKDGVVVRRLAMRTRLWLFKCARDSRARAVPNTHHGRVAAGAASIEMRRINDISD
jgi:hypothetical protein